MDNIAQQIADIEETLRKTPHHKATNHFIGLMRAKIARLKDKQIESSSKGGGGGGYAVKKHGDATVVLVGPPSSGKSTLLNRLTNAESKVASYAFTTLHVIPGMFKHNEAYIQILDIPGLIEGAKEGKGRGREVISVARNADLLLIMSEVKRENFIEKILKELTGAGIRINEVPPKVLIDKKVSGGLDVHSNVRQEFDLNTVKDIAREFGIKNGDITLKEKMSYERLFDAFSTSRVYIPAVFAINKVDQVGNIKRKGGIIYFSAQSGTGMDDLINAIWRCLKLVTVYLVREDEDPGHSNPIVMKEGNTLYDVAEKIGSDFREGKINAKIWGNSAKFPGQEVSLKTQITDRMQVRFIS